MHDPQSRVSRDLVELLEPRSDEIAEAALRHCESTIPELRTAPRRDREAGLAAVRLGISGRLAAAASGALSGVPQALRDHYRDAAARGVPLLLQLQVARGVAVFTMQRYWDLVGPDHASEMLAFTRAAAQYQRTVEGVIMDCYRDRQGVDGVVDADVRQVTAEALLSGQPLPLAQGRVSYPAYLVMVVPRPPGAEQLDRSVTAADLLHVERDRSDVVLVPHRAAPAAALSRAADIGAGARRVGRPVAAAAWAARPGDVPEAYALALMLAGLVPPSESRPVVTVPDLLPELAVASSRPTADGLLELLAPVTRRPDLLGTLRALMSCDLERGVTAQKLGIHRRTLTLRLGRISELTGHDPRRARGAMVLGMALIALDQRGGAGSAGPDGRHPPARV